MDWASVAVPPTNQAKPLPTPFLRCAGDSDDALQR
jgi:hypothetical protein